MDIATLDQSTASVDQVPVADLVAAASAGDERAWEEIVVRYQPIIRSVSRRYRLSYEEGADLSQSLWLKLTSHLGDLREPAALPGWIKTTASRLAMASVEARRRVVPTETATEGPDWSEPLLVDVSTDAEAQVLSDERRTAVRRGLSELSDKHRTLLTMLVAEPPISYQDISTRLGLPVGSIGPTRARVLRKLAETTAMRGLVEAYGVAA